PFLRFAGAGIGAAEDKYPVGEMAERRPGFLAVDNVMIALAFGPRLQRGEVGASAGLGIALAPKIRPLKNARQVIIFLLLIAEGHQNRPQHHRPEGRDRQGLRPGALLLKNVSLSRGPAGSAVFLRPARGAPSLLEEELLPGEEILLG